MCSDASIRRAFTVTYSHRQSVFMYTAAGADGTHAFVESQKAHWTQPHTRCA